MAGSSDECWLVRQTLALIDIQFLQLDCSTALSSNLGRAPLANQIDGGGKFQWFVFLILTGIAVLLLKSSKPTFNEPVRMS